MKIGILTFHAAHNYGAALQCYALKSFLSSLGNDVAVIDYRPDWMIQGNKWVRKENFISYNIFRTIAKSLREFTVLPYRRSRYIKYENFISKNLNLKDIESINSAPYDLIIVGSDQVWNTKITRGFDKYYWGAFKKPNNTKLISYAASMNDHFSDEQIEIIKNNIGNFSEISVREKGAIKSLNPYLHDKKIISVVDPVLLVNRQRWDELAKKPQVNYEYVFLYQVEKNSLSVRIAQLLAAKLGCRIVTLSARVEDANTRVVRASSPEEFIGLFKYAKAVVCSSFHGTMFSLIYNRPFYSIKMNKDKDNRVGNILNILNLEKRFVDDEKLIDFEYKFDWNLINNKLSQLTDVSMNYLKNNCEYDLR